ncbi:hypothetical protein I4U23_012556 [Adineta vaga]|nr:hypothetical protein I4U23_012556 [Adineta vaga]
MNAASEEELSVLKSIFNEDFVLLSNDDELPIFDLIIRFDFLPNKTILIHQLSNISTEISHLPPITLRLTYKQTYPQIDPPIYCILCDYLTSDQLTFLTNQIDAKWQSGEVIVYTWIELLKEYVYSLSDRLILCSTLSSITDKRFETNYDKIGSKRIYEQLIEYNRMQDQHEFDQNIHTCPICLQDEDAKNCLQFEKCHHYACLSCLNSHAKQCLNNNHQIKQINCYDCNSTLFLSELRRMFSDDKLLLKYQQRLLEQTVDMVWCPRCNHSIICIPSESTSGNHSSFAECSHCEFTFCRRCQECWHPQLECPKQKLFEKLMQDPKDESTFRNPIEIKKLLLEISNIQTIERCSKPCPACTVRIEKNGGCQHMHCRACQVHFCWECGWYGRAYVPHPCERKPEKAGAILTPELNEQVARVFYDSSGKAIETDIAKRVQLCPKKDCREAHVKIGTKNSLFCGKCETNFCFVCGEQIYGNFHFSEYGCSLLTKI